MDADIIVANEVPDDVIKSLAQRKGKNNKDKAPIVLALCSHQSRFNRAYSPSNSTRPHVGYLAKPVGPLKLARSLVQCLNGIQGRLTGGISGSAGSQSSSIVATNDLSNIFEDLSMSAHSGEILDNSRMAAGSDNARKALESPTPNASQERKEEFPFPSSGESKPLSTTVPRSPMATVAASNIERTAKSIRLPPRSPASTPLPLSPLIDAPAPIFSQALRTTTTAPRKDRKLPSPRLLLVDDNKINLRLLNMYIKKRGYDVVDLAENGQEAVDKVINSFVVADAEGESGGGGYDVIFMDISMPVLDGFGATRKIREIERGRVGIEQQLGGAKPGGESRNEKGTERRGDRGTRSPALVIALTGLASSRDQSEAFTSGVDLFLTKPVAFKEVGKMLDNWEANREREVEKERGARV
jgi:CheY-like chemotaxis protein